MLELPSSLDAVEPLARAVYGSGWRRGYSSGPTRNELVEIIDAALRERGVDTPRLKLAVGLQRSSVMLRAHDRRQIVASQDVGLEGTWSECRGSRGYRSQHYAGGELLTSSGDDIRSWLLICA